MWGQRVWGQPAWGQPVTLYPCRRLADRGALGYRPHRSTRRPRSLTAQRTQVPGLMVLQGWAPA